MTPPPIADAGSSIPPATLSDASVPADAATPPATPADGSAPATTADAGAAPTTPTPPVTNPLRLRINLEGGLSWMDLGNNAGLDHFGGYGRVELGGEYRINTNVFAQFGAGGSFGWLNRGLGAGVNSSLNAQSLFANGRLGYSLLDGNLRFHGGIQLGAVHVGSPECVDGTSCGAVFTRNPQLLPVDSWGFQFGGEVGVTTLQGGLGLYLRASGMFGVNPAYDVVDGDHLNFGLNIPDVQIGIGVDVMSLINLFTGAGRAPAAAHHDPETPAVPAVPGSTEATPTGPSVEAPVTGIALVRARRESASAARSEALAAAELVTSARTAYSAIAGATPEDAARRRSQALEVSTQAHTVLSSYQDIRDLLVEAQAALPNLTGAERREATRIIQEITNWQSEIRRVGGQVYRQAMQTLSAYNQRTDHPDDQDLPISMEDPAPAPVHATPEPGHRRRRVVTPPVVTPPVVTPPVVTPPVVTHPPVVTPPVVTHPPVVTPPVVTPPVVHPPASRDAGVPALIFGGGTPSGVTSGGGTRPDAGRPHRVGE